MILGEAFLTPFVNSLLSSLIEKGWAAKDSSKEQTILRRLLRERLRREMRYNYELLKESKLSAPIRVANLREEAIAGC